MRLERSPLLPPILALAALLAACAPTTATTEKAPPIEAEASADLPPIPVCRDEMRAFVELSRLAKLHGDGWIVFEPAVAALKQQIIDCIDENQESLKSAI